MNHSFYGSILKSIGLFHPSYQDKDKINENISLYQFEKTMRQIDICRDVALLRLYCLMCCNHYLN
ncbi:hypothetical protein Cal6303_1609 [Calothrix sp. PCC 6303]|nr:hypothetical protein Cal6303_1609 [Calothrix sp. PCC 6303]